MESGCYWILLILEWLLRLKFLIKWSGILYFGWRYDVWICCDCGEYQEALRVFMSSHLCLLSKGLLG